jgi:hypothetical protein
MPQNTPYCTGFLSLALSGLDRSSIPDSSSQPPMGLTFIARGDLMYGNRTRQGYARKRTLKLAGHFSIIR